MSLLKYLKLLWLLFCSLCKNYATFHVETWSHCFQPHFLSVFISVLASQFVLALGDLKSPYSDVTFYKNDKNGASKKLVEWLGEKTLELVSTKFRLNFWGTF